MWDGFNKRKFPRINVRCDVTVRSKEASKELSAITENLGVGGVCMVLSDELKRFEPCHVSIELDPKQPLVECEGKAVWIVPTQTSKSKKTSYDTGIEFSNLSVEDAKRIQEYLAMIVSK